MNNRLVLNISALQKTGLQELQQQIDAYFLNIETTGFFNYNRQQQNIYWLEETLQQELLQRFTQNNNLQILKKEIIAKINSNEITPTNAAKLLLPFKLLATAFTSSKVIAGNNCL